MLVFFGLFVGSPEQAAALSTARWDEIALFFDKVFVDGKFYSIFSLLFGIGFGLQLARGGEAAVPRFKRRLRILLAIGAVHAFLLWFGDILMLYALLGFFMPWFARKSDRELLRWVVILLAIPTALYFVALGAFSLLASGEPGATNGGPPAALFPIFEVMGRGGVKDAIVGNLVFVAARWADLFVTVRFPKVLGMFVLGLWVVRSGLLQSPAAHRSTFVRWSLLGWAVGLPANVVLSYGFGFGLWWRIGAAQALGIAALIIALQIPLSAWWLSRYRYGPVEWIWRRLTYRQPLALRATAQ